MGIPMWEAFTGSSPWPPVDFNALKLGATQSKKLAGNAPCFISKTLDSLIS